MLKIEPSRPRRTSQSTSSVPAPVSASVWASAAAIVVLPSPGAADVTSRVRGGRPERESRSDAQTVRTSSAAIGFAGRSMASADGRPAPDCSRVASDMPASCAAPGRLRRIRPSRRRGGGDIWTNGSVPSTGSEVQLLDFLDGRDGRVPVVADECDADPERESQHRGEREIPQGPRAVDRIGRKRLLDHAKAAELHAGREAGLLQLLEHAVVQLPVLVGLALDHVELERGRVQLVRHLLLFRG